MNGARVRISRVTVEARYGLFMAVMVATAFACDAPDTRESVDIQRTDSAGIIIIATPGEAARAPIGWTVDSVPDLQIGVVGGDRPYQFDRIRGISADGEGNIRVVDSGSRQVRIFDRAGSVLHLLGGAGAGPGEFQFPELVRGLSDDTLVIFDFRARRLTLYSRHGDVLAVSPPLQFAGGSPRAVGAVARHVLLDDAGVLWMGPNPPPQPGILRLVDAVTGSLRIIGEFPGRRMFYDGRGEIGAVQGIPFDIRPTAAAGPRSFFITPGEGPHILEYDTLSQLRRILRLDEPIRPVTEEDLEELVQWRVASAGSEWESYIREGYEPLQLPEIMPAFDDLRVDADGWLWARIYKPIRDDTAPATWIVFAPEGRACGTVQVPGSLEVHYIGRDFVLGRWRDELNVEYVRRHLLDRSAPC